MKKYFSLLAIFCLTSFSGYAFTTVEKDGKNSSDIEDFLNPISPSYTDYLMMEDWKSNWFIGVQGGETSFIGSPKSCGDLFSNAYPSFNAYVGKFITPTVALRIFGQYGEFKGADMNKHHYLGFHSDLMYNIGHFFRNRKNSTSKWSLMPYVGVGIGKGVDLVDETCDSEECNGTNLPFLFSYGMQLGLSITERLRLTAEFSGFTTFTDFDGAQYGTRRKIGDTMLGLSAGLSYTIGRTGWKQAVDATPYVIQNKMLMDYINNLRKGDSSSSSEENNNGNSYRGLDSLKARLEAARNLNSLDDADGNNSEDSENILKVPVYLFFQLGKVELTDPSQLVNLDNIAKAVIKHNLSIRIDGAADKATGSNEINTKLSIGRANYVADELIKRGVNKDSIKRIAHGGVNFQKKPRENRYACVSLYVEE